MDLTDALGLTGGLVAVTGAGGKKTLIYRLVREHLARPAVARLGVTATVRIQPFPPGLRAIVAPEARLLAAVTGAAAGPGCIAFAQPPDGHRGRLRGLSPEQVTRIHRAAAFDLTLVKADGARMNWIKAPGDHEPVVPPGTDLVVPVVAAAALGRPLTRAHRPERIAAVTGLAAGAPLTPAHLARLLVSRRGMLGGTEGRRTVPVITVFDPPGANESGAGESGANESGAGESGRLALAHAAAAQALATLPADKPPFDRIVLAALHRADPVLAIVRR